MREEKVMDRERKTETETETTVHIVGNLAAKAAIKQWRKEKKAPLIVTGAVGTGKTTAVKQLVPDLLHFDFDECSVAFVEGQFRKASEEQKTLFLLSILLFLINLIF